MPKTTLHLIDRLVELRNECDNDPNRCKEYSDKIRARDIARSQRAAKLALDAGRAKPITRIDEDGNKQTILGKEWTVEDKEKLQAIEDGHLTIHGLPMTLDDLRMPAKRLRSEDSPKGSPPCELALYDLIYPFLVDVLSEEARDDPVKDDKSRFDIAIAKVLQELEKRPSLMEDDHIPYEMAVNETELHTFFVERDEWRREELPSNRLNLTEREQWIIKMFDRLHEKGITEALFGDNETKRLPKVADELLGTKGEANVQTAASRPPAPSVGKSKPITQQEAGNKARELLDADPTFRNKTQREWAGAIGCSTGLVQRLPARKAVMEQRKNDAAQEADGAIPEARPQAVSLTSKMEAVVGKDNDPAKIAEYNELFERLIASATPEECERLRELGPEQRRKLVNTYAEQCAEAEPSPCDPDPVGKKPPEVRTHKKL